MTDEHDSPADEREPPAGWTPWDPVNGLRVGVLAGGLVGVAATALIGGRAAWLILVGGALGGAVGYWTQTRRTPRRSGPGAADDP